MMITAVIANTRIMSTDAFRVVLGTGAVIAEKRTALRPCEMGAVL
jgi:hypothetical protein